VAWGLAGGRVRVLGSGGWGVPAGLAGEERFEHLVPSRRGGVWVVERREDTPGGYRVRHLAMAGAGGESTEVFLPGRNRAQVTALAEDVSGTLWLGTRGAGVFFRADGSAWQLLPGSGELAESIVTGIQADEDGSVWLGTVGAGLYQVRPQPVRVLRPPGPAGQNAVQAACGTADGAVWMGTDGAGAFRHRAGRVEHFGTGEGLDDPSVGVLLEDRDGQLWAGTPSGLYGFREGRFHRAGFSRGLRVLSLLEDRAGRLWVGVAGGLVRADGTSARLYGRQAGLPGANILALSEDRQGRIWAAAPGFGLYCQTNEAFARVALDGWPEDGSVRALHHDHAGALWIAGYGQGLFCLQEGQFRRWNSGDGLPDDGIHGLVEDDAGVLWMASDGGIFSCEKAELERYRRGSSPPLACRRISGEDGLPSLLCVGYGQPSVGRGADGSLWFPSGHALAGFHPRRLPGLSRLRALVVEELVADGESRRVTGGSVRLEPGVRQLAFHYTLPDLLDGGRLRFFYRLEGLDPQWIPGEQRRSASYRNLPPGRYRFQLRASGPAGNQVDNGPGLEVELPPRWWERTGVGFAGVLVAAGAVGTVAWRAARVRARQELRRFELDRRVEQERRRIAQDLHDELGAGLAEMMLLAEAAGQPGRSPGETEAWTVRLADRARQLAGTTDEIVWTLNPRSDSLPSLVGYLSDHAQTFLGAAGLGCRLDIPGEVPARPVDARVRHGLLLAFKEVLHNTQKHSQATEVYVRMHFPPGLLRVVVEDNGRGFPPGGEVPPGQGLESLRERLAAMGGQARFGNREAGGAVVTLELHEAGHRTGPLG
ncbi:MAG: two-component regulator propeller domain-containing protein, partial [Verrucomicrobiota bacterium]